MKIYANIITLVRYKINFKCEFYLFDKLISNYICFSHKINFAFKEWYYNFNRLELTICLGLSL